MPRGYPGSTPGVDPRSQGVIPKRFKRKKIFVTPPDGRTHRRDGRNSDVDLVNTFLALFRKVLTSEKFLGHLKIKIHMVIIARPKILISNE